MEFHKIKPPPFSLPFFKKMKFTIDNSVIKDGLQNVGKLA